VSYVGKLRTESDPGVSRTIKVAHATKMVKMAKKLPTNQKLFNSVL